MNRQERIQAIIENLARFQRPALGAAWKYLGLSHAQMGLLYLLYHHDLASVKETADHLGVSKSAVSQLADPLVDKGLVTRQADSADRRIVRLRLTAEGARELKKLGKYKFDGVRAAIDSLDDADLEHLQLLIQKAAIKSQKETDG